MKFKKIFAIIFAFILLSACLMLTVSAKSDTVTVSDDYSSLSIDGKKYVRIKSENIYDISLSDHSNNITFESGDESILYADAYFNNFAVKLNVNYKNGGFGSYHFIIESELDNYNDMLRIGGDRFTTWRTDAVITLPKDKLFAEKITIKGYETDQYIFFSDVITHGMNGNISVYYGQLIYDNSKSFIFIPIPSYESISMNTEVTAYRITDKELISDLVSSSDIYFPDSEGDGSEADAETGFLFAGIIVFLLVFIPLPLIASIILFSKSFTKDDEFKLHLRIISALCAATCVMSFITVVISILMAA